MLRLVSGGDATIDDYRRGAFSAYVIKETQADHYFEADKDLGGLGLFDDFDWR
jgi:hypothetical protein